MSEDEILTVKDIAKYLKMSKATVYTLIRSGKIPVKRIGFEWRTTKKVLNQLFIFCVDRPSK